MSWQKDPYTTTWRFFEYTKSFNIYIYEILLKDMDLRHVPTDACFFFLIWHWNKLVWFCLA